MFPHAISGRRTHRLVDQSQSATFAAVCSWSSSKSTFPAEAVGSIIIVSASWRKLLQGVHWTRAGLSEGASPKNQRAFSMYLTHPIISLPPNMQR